MLEINILALLHRESQMIVFHIFTTRNAEDTLEPEVTRSNRTTTIYGNTETYSELCQTSKMEVFTEIVKS